jgi:hypothetical protein
VSRARPEDVLIVGVGVVVFVALIIATVHGVRTRDKERYSALAALQRPTPLKGILIGSRVVLSLLVR